MSDFDSKLKAYKALKDYLKILEEDLLKDLTTWRSKAFYGFKYQAIIQVKKDLNLSVTEAKDMVESFMDYSHV